MRIISEFNLDQIKVTVFKMNEKLSVKYEYNLLEQTYKFRDGSGIQTVSDVHKFSEGNVLNEIISTFEKMNTLRLNGLEHLNIQSELEQFDDIL